MKDASVASQSGPTVWLVDEVKIARRSAVVQEALSELGRSDQVNVLPTVEVLTHEEARRLACNTLVTPGDLIFVVVSDREMAGLSNDSRLPRIACDAVACGYHLLEKLPIETDVYFVVRDEMITGIDVISLLLSGARGVIGLDTLGSSGQFALLLRACHEGDKALRRIVSGGAYLRLNELREMAIGRWQLPPPHWALLLAMAQIPQTRLPVRGNKPKQKGIAEEVAKWDRSTGYIVSTSTARQLPLILELVNDELNLLEDREESVDYQAEKGRQLDSAEMYELPYLPLYARSLGFPRFVVPVRGVGDDSLVDNLYKGLRGIEIVSVTTHESFRTAHVTIARNLQTISPSRRLQQQHNIQIQGEDK